MENSRGWRSTVNLPDMESLGGWEVKLEKKTSVEGYGDFLEPHKAE